MRIVVFEADPEVAGRVVAALRAEGLTARWLPRPTRIIEPDELAVIGLADGDRLALCRQLRADHHRRGIIMLSPHADEAHLVEAFDAGADDVLHRQTVSYRELAGRLRAVGLRTGGALDAKLIPPPPLEPAVRVGRWAGGGVRLTMSEIQFLTPLVTAPGRTFKRQTLEFIVWGDRPIGHRALDGLVKRLRTRLGARGRDIESVRGVGYRLRTDA